MAKRTTQNLYWKQTGISLKKKKSIQGNMIKSSEIRSLIFTEVIHISMQLVHESTGKFYTWNSNMSACFLASLATSSRMALTRAEVERLLRGVSGLIRSPGSARLRWDAAVEEEGGWSGPPWVAWRWCHRRGLPWG